MVTLAFGYAVSLILPRHGISFLCRQLQGHEEAQDDKTLAFNAFKDSCPSLTKKRVELFKGFDYRDIERRKAARLWPSMPSRTLALHECSMHDIAAAIHASLP